jgi:hypothetical protein
VDRRITHSNTQATPDVGVLPKFTTTYRDRAAVRDFASDRLGPLSERNSEDAYPTCYARSWRGLRDTLASQRDENHPPHRRLGANRSGCGRPRIAGVSPITHSYLGANYNNATRDKACAASAGSVPAYPRRHHAGLRRFRPIDRHALGDSGRGLAAPADPYAGRPRPRPRAAPPLHRQPDPAGHRRGPGQTGPHLYPPALETPAP